MQSSFFTTVGVLLASFPFIAVFGFRRLIRRGLEGDVLAVGVGLGFGFGFGFGLLLLCVVVEFLFEVLGFFTYAFSGVGDVLGYGLCPAFLFWC